MAPGSLIWKDLPPTIGKWDNRPKIVDYLLDSINEARQSSQWCFESDICFPRYRVSKATISVHLKMNVRRYWRQLLEKRNVEQLPPDLPVYDWMCAKEGFADFKEYYRQLRPFSCRIIFQTAVARLLGDDQGFVRLERSAEEFSDWCRSEDFNLWAGDYDLLETVENYAHFLDMFGDRLHEDRRQDILNGIEAAARKSREILEVYRLAECPLDSHVVHQAFMYGNLCAVLAGNKRDLGHEGLTYLSKIYRRAWPFFGYRDGGWGMGVAYWQWQLCGAINGAEAIRDLGYYDLTKTPFLRHTGDFKWMVHSPYFRMGCFGDSSDLKPTVLDYAIMGLLGKMYNNDLYRRYVGQFEQQRKPDYNPGPDSSLVMALLLLAKTWKEPYENVWPQGKIGSRSSVFKQTGIASCHTALGDVTKDFIINFRSSKWGSYGHAHADQNSFVVQAFGEPMFIDAGYYPSYHHSHMKGFAIQTAAHNALLVNGAGQVPRNVNSQGRIEEFKSEENFDYMAGECAKAYGEDVTKCRRQILVGKDVSFPWLLVVDRVSLKQPGSIDFLLHSYEEPVFNSERNEAMFKGWKIYGGSVKCRVKWLELQRLYWSQTDRFPYPADDRESNKPNQWHCRLTTADPLKEHLLLTVFLFYRQSSKSSIFAPRQEVQLPEVLHSETRSSIQVAIGEARVVYSKARDTLDWSVPKL